MRTLNEALLRGMAALLGHHHHRKGEEGQTLAEYGLLITIIAVGIVGLALLAFRTQLAAAFAAAGACLDGAC